MEAKVWGPLNLGRQKRLQERTGVRQRRRYDIPFHPALPSPARLTGPSQIPSFRMGHSSPGLSTSCSSCGSKSSFTQEPGLQSLTLPLVCVPHPIASWAISVCFPLPEPLWELPAPPPPGQTLNSSVSPFPNWAPWHLTFPKTQLLCVPLTCPAVLVLNQSLSLVTINRK